MEPEVLISTPLTSVEAKMIYITFCGRHRVNVPEAVKAGMIPKAQLTHNQEYIGYCRSYTKGTWDAVNNVFVGKRHKFLECYDEFTVHPEDDEGFDVFVPVAELEVG